MTSMAACQSVPFVADRDQINFYLQTLLDNYSEASACSVLDAMKYAALGGGQRIRPVLAMQIARLLGSAPDLTLAAAGAVELLHCASLIIDDLPCMDDALLRRQQATVHVKFGEPVAILAAFGLVALAARSVVERDLSPEDRERVTGFQIELLRTLDCAGLIAGQALDLEAGERGNQQVADMKTARLFSLAVEAGSLVPVTDENTHAVLAGFGREFGLAFQLVDDLLDGEGEDPEPFREKLELLRALVAHFGPAGSDLESLIDYLDERVSSHLLC